MHECICFNCAACFQAGSSDSIADLLRLGSSAVSNGDEVAALHAHALQVSFHCRNVIDLSVHDFCDLIPSSNFKNMT